MRKIAAFAFVLILALVLTSIVLAGFFSPVSEEFRTIRIRPDGSVDPATAPIQRDGDKYYFTGNVSVSPSVQTALVVEKDNIVIDGAGYTLQGMYNGVKDVPWTVGQGPYNETEALLWTLGIDIADISRCNLTITNLNIKNFSIGLFIWTSNNTIVGNSITDNVVGIMVSESSNNIVGNYIANNEEGIFLAVNGFGCYAENMNSYHNSFVNNIQQVSGCQCVDSSETCMVYSTNAWNNDREGNYWSDYNGTDADGDGIGDTPYVIDINNQDNYPLMNPIATRQVVADFLSETAPFPVEWITAPVVSVVAVDAALFAYFKKRNH